MCVCVCVRMCVSVSVCVPCTSPHSSCYRRVADELLETERIYCSALSTALQQYFPPLLGADATAPEGIKNRVGAVFGNLQSVEMYHRE